MTHLLPKLSLLLLMVLKMEESILVVVRVFAGLVFKAANLEPLKASLFCTAERTMIE